METSITQALLSDRYKQLKNQKPYLRMRDAARSLGVSEAELLYHGSEADVKALRPDFHGIFSALESLGSVMALTRNESAVHERHGVYSNFSSPNAHMGLLVNPDIDLRIFFAPWRFAFSVVEEVKGKSRRSLQFFSSWGEALHKIYLTKASDSKAFDALCLAFQSDQAPDFTHLEVKPVGEQRGEPDASSLQSFAEAWMNMKDTHDFYGLYKKHKLSRLQALEEAPKVSAPDGLPYTKRCEKAVLERVLQSAAAQEVPIMVFIGNPGMIQIHSGVVKNLMWHETWYNVMDRDFQMHLNMADVQEAWIVRKPTVDGFVQSIELFDAEEQLIAQFFGARKPGLPELEGWKRLILHELEA